MLAKYTIKTFTHLGEWIAEHPRLVLLVTFTICAFFASYLPQLKIASTVEGLLPDNSEERLAYNTMRERYGKSDHVILAIIGSPVLDIEYLNTLRELHEAIVDHVPHIATVESLVNATNIYGADDEVIIEDLLQRQPETAEDLDSLRVRLGDSQTYYGRLINEQEDTSVIFIQLSAQVPYFNDLGETAYRPILEADMTESLAALETIKQRYEGRFHAQMIVGGETAMAVRMTNALDHAMRVFIGLSIAITVIILGFYFRRVSGVLMPLVTMGLSLVVSMALFPLLGFPIQLTTSILPSFLLTVCVGDSVHLLNAFYTHFDRGVPKRAAIKRAYAQCQTPILMTSLTTAAGLLSLATSGVVPIRTLGIVASIGVMIGWYVTILVVPALILTCPVKRRPDTAYSVVENDLLLRFTRACYRLSTTYPLWVVGVASVTFALSMFYAYKLEVSNNPKEWFNKEDPIRLAVTQIEDKLSVGTMFEIIVDTGEPRGIYNPELLKKVEASLAQFENKTISGLRLGKANSVIEMVKQTNKVLHGNDSTYYALPSTRQGVAQALLLVEMDRANDLYQFTNDTFSEMRIVLLTTSADARDIMQAQDFMEASFNEHMGHSNTLRFTGMAQLMPKVLLEIGKTLIVSILGSVSIITIMMILMLKSVRMGLLSMIPNLYPITIVLGFMYLAGIPLDIFTVMLASIALGIAVDDTMHFMHSAHHSYAAHGCTRLAIEEAYSFCGRAMIGTSIALFFGFVVYGFSAIHSLLNFGMLMALNIVLALLADLLLTPALLMLFLKDGSRW